MPTSNPKAAIAEHLLGLKSRGVAKVAISADTLATLSAMSMPAKPKANPSTSSTAGAPKSVSASEPSFRVAEPAAPFTPDAPMAKKPSNAQKLQDIPTIELPAGDKKTQWEWLKQRVLSDPIVTKNLRPGKEAVFGVGNLDSPIFFCGEAPGADEEKQGIPFVGRAGQLLRKIIGAMDVDAEDLYIGNILNWRPSMPDGSEFGNRPPTVDEMTACLPFLKAQIAIVQPKVIVALGATAVTGLLGYDPNRRMGKVRGQFHDFDGTDVMITYHPSYLLRNNTNESKRIVWEDILKVMEKVGMPITPKQQKFFT